MTNEEQQINELMKDINTVRAIQASTVYTPQYFEAKCLINLGYRKISEDEIVIPKQQYDELQAGKNFDYEYDRGAKMMELYYKRFGIPETQQQATINIVNKIKELSQQIVQPTSSGVVKLYCIDEETLNLLAKQSKQDANNK